MVMRNGEDVDPRQWSSRTRGRGTATRAIAVLRDLEGGLPRHKRPGVRPNPCMLDHAVISGEELQTEPVTLVVVPNGSGIDLGRRIGMNGDCGVQPLVGRPATRSRRLAQSSRKWDRSAPAGPRRSNRRRMPWPPCRRRHAPRRGWRMRSAAIAHVRRRATLGRHEARHWRCHSGPAVRLVGYQRLGRDPDRRAHSPLLGCQLRRLESGPSRPAPCHLRAITSGHGR